MDTFIKHAISFIPDAQKRERINIQKAISIQGIMTIRSKTDIEKFALQNTDMFTFALRAKKTKKSMLENLKYQIMDYPKGDNNKDYSLGYVLEQKIIYKKS